MLDSTDHPSVVGLQGRCNGSIIQSGKIKQLQSYPVKDNMKKLNISSANGTLASTGKALRAAFESLNYDRVATGYNQQHYNMDRPV